MKTWLILGAGGHGRSLASVINFRGDKVGAISDGSLTEGFVFFAGNRVKSFSSDATAIELARASSWDICLGIGDNKAREAVGAQLVSDDSLQHLLAPLLAITASVDLLANVAALAHVGEHAHVGPGASIGEGAILNTAAIVEHDAQVGKYTHVAPGGTVLGGSTIGDRSFGGSGARILPALTVVDDVTVGAGATFCSTGTR